MSSEKNRIRERMKSERAAEAHSAEKSERICALLENSEAFLRAHSVLFFAATHGEPDLIPLAQKILGRKTVLFPFVTDAKKGEMSAAKITDLSELIPAEFGIRAPCHRHPFPETPDLILVPAIAIDHQGNRIGFGGGYYDRFLRNISAKKIAVVFDTQILPEVPSDPWDEKMNGIVSESEILIFSSVKI